MEVEGEVSRKSLRNGIIMAFGSGKGSAGGVRFFGSGTNAEKDRSSGNWRCTVAAGKAKWKSRLMTHYTSNQPAGRPGASYPSSTTSFLSTGSLATS